METTEDRPAYLAMAEDITGPVSVTELADVQDEIEHEHSIWRQRDKALRDRRNAMITYMLNHGTAPAELVRPTGLTSTQLGRIRDGKVSGRRAAARTPADES